MKLQTVEFLEFKYYAYVNQYIYIYIGLDYKCNGHSYTMTYNYYSIGLNN